ncbi:MAG: tRNA (uridine(34)/cytosine(34)/5-carboxymethylaminomethyluridine(34)-2'-O)-methyltransferase TrmL [Methylophilales bacterium RIFCSPHIGHO2_02_FULL_57_10]|nr:MAG: tRNA (uridine(34)/cytosine(34)/5-carboxymethylaminomethyluridine(34)-2'-O)-methyltransferase TrmL [Methylophilales bacterium RIFCSPHIGHO2_02_FULL_57_10]
MFDLVLYQPEIPPNTGNIIRLCANTGTRLHLVKPLGFDLDDKQLRRAGLDYHEYASLHLHDSWEDCLAALEGKRLFAVTTKGATRHTDIHYQPGDAFVLGPETRGLPPEILEKFAPQRRLRLPMLPHSRSLNLSNSAAVLIYEAWRQNGFEGGV